MKKVMQITNIHEAKSHLSKLLELVFQGEEVIICKAGKPIAKLIKYSNVEQSRVPGYWKNKVRISKDFDELPLSLKAAFQGESH